MEPKFLTDDMLGKLTRWLRIIGYDVLYSRQLGVGDKGIIEHSKKSGRIVVSRDRELARKSKGILLTKTDVEGQLLELIKEARKFKIRLKIPQEPEKIFCPLCNSNLYIIRKEDYKEQIPEKVYRLQDNFWACSACNKVYWQGRHWERICRLLEKLKERR